MKGSWFEKGHYEIIIDGRIDDNWQDYFNSIVIRYENDNTIIAIEISDQSALHGLFSRIRDLGLSIISVSRIDSNIINQELE